MEVTITAEAVIQAAALAGALGALGGGLVWLFRFVEGNKQQDQALTAAVFTQFNSAYSVLLLIAFSYEALSQLAAGGSTLGKLAMGLRVVPQNPARGRLLHSLLLCVRSALKMLALYLFQGFPFLICCLTIFTNGECRTGFDMAVKSVTVPRAGGPSQR